MIWLFLFILVSYGLCNVLNTDCALWLGSNDLDSQGDFRWLPSGRQLTFVNWDENQPDNQYEHCIAYVHQSRKWHDVNCVNPGINKLICED